MDENKTIKSFADLNSWKESRKLAVKVYEVTKKYPKEEMFGLTNQSRRCAVSISSNIAEGFSRQSYKEKVQFYSISLGSTTELQSQLLIAKDVGFLDTIDYNSLINQSIIVHKLLNGLVKSSKNHDS
ncbi:MAG: four helix bundle protein [Candidatus Berkelbacteria bacterium]